MAVGFGRPGPRDGGETHAVDPGFIVYNERTGLEWHDDLRCPARVRRQADRRCGSLPVELCDIGDHYPETLRRWRLNLADRDAEVSALGLPAEFRRLWNLYLTYCEAAFLERHVSDVQLVLAKPAGGRMCRKAGDTQLSIAARARRSLLSPGR